MKNRLINFVFLVVLASIFQSVGASGAALVKDMVHFDRDYIPVLAMTKQGKLKKSRIAMARLNKTWTDFRRRHGQGVEGDSLWRNDMSAIAASIRKAGAIIRSGKNLIKAHQEAERVRIIMMKLRERNHIDYYVDHLTRFHEPMERIVLSVKGKTVKTLSGRNIATIRRNMPLARKLWKSIVNARFDAGLFEFSPAKTAMLRKSIQKENRTISRLERALGTNNRKEIIKASLALKANFARVFKLFGNFRLGS